MKFQRVLRAVPRRPPMVRTKSPPNETTAFVSGGIGDWLSIESLTPLETLQRIKTFYVASPLHEALCQMILAAYPRAACEVVWRSEYPFHYYDTLGSFLRDSRVDASSIPPHPVELTFGAVLRQAANNRGVYRGSTYVRKRMADISALGLPEKFCLVALGSGNLRKGTRNFTAVEWEAGREGLRAMGLAPVLVQSSPDTDSFDVAGAIDLRNKTTVLESIEVCKQSSAYLGVDSWTTVICSKVLPAERLLIKRVDGWDPHSKAFMLRAFFNPLTDVPFFGPDVCAMLPSWSQGLI